VGAYPCVCGCEYVNRSALAPHEAHSSPQPTGGSILNTRRAGGAWCARTCVCACAPSTSSTQPALLGPGARAARGGRFKFKLFKPKPNCFLLYCLNSSALNSKAVRRPTPKPPAGGYGDRPAGHPENQRRDPLGSASDLPPAYGIPAGERKRPGC
jgi:hypothetical protein